MSAPRAYSEAAIRLFGEYAYLNKVTKHGSKRDYETIRGLWMIPGAVLLVWHQGSYIPLSGTAIALAYPWVMVVACTAQDNWELDEGTAVVIEHIIMGYLIGTYMLAGAG